MNIDSLIIPTPLGDILAIADKDALLILEFADSKELEYKIQKIISFPETTSIPSSRKEWENNPILIQVQEQLSEYFDGKRQIFTIPSKPYGTEFQKKAWKALEKIPYGETRSYQEEATMIGNPKSVRAIGGANHNNPIVIIIPCHRVIGKSGKLVGYGGGIERKIWLLDHEKKF